MFRVQHGVRALQFRVHGSSRGAQRKFGFLQTVSGSQGVCGMLHRHGFGVGHQVKIFEQLSPSTVGPGKEEKKRKKENENENNGTHNGTHKWNTQMEHTTEIVQSAYIRHTSTLEDQK